jgi:heptose I phosphotransferase
MIEIAEELRDKFSEADAFDLVMALDGDVYRAKEGRRTLLFTHGGREYFAKIHSGIGWGEIWKNLSRFRLPITDASNEWKAVDLLERVGVETVKIVGKGTRGRNPAKIESFVIMRALDERVEVEDFLKDFGGLTGASRLRLKRKIVRNVAEAARRMHGAGMNHRDFYLCHFHILEREWTGNEEMVRLPLIDLHRAQIREKVPRRWLVKDLGALLFSAIDCEITDRDLVAFLRVYLGENWKKELKEDPKFWAGVFKRAAKFYRRHRAQSPVFPGVFQKIGEG